MSSREQTAYDFKIVIDRHLWMRVLRVEDLLIKRLHDKLIKLPNRLRPPIVDLHKLLNRELFPIHHFPLGGKFALVVE